MKKIISQILVVIFIVTLMLNFNVTNPKAVSNEAAVSSEFFTYELTRENSIEIINPDYSSYEIETNASIENGASYNYITKTSSEWRDSISDIDTGITGNLSIMNYDNVKIQLEAGDKITLKIPAILKDNIKVIPYEIFNKYTLKGNNAYEITNINNSDSVIKFRSKTDKINLDYIISTTNLYYNKEIESIGNDKEINKLLYSGIERTLKVKFNGSEDIVLLVPKESSPIITNLGAIEILEELNIKKSETYTIKNINNGYLRTDISNLVDYSLYDDLNKPIVYEREDKSVREIIKNNNTLKVTNNNYDQVKIAYPKGYNLDIQKASTSVFKEIIMNKGESYSVDAQNYYIELIGDGKNFIPMDVVEYYEGKISYIGEKTSGSIYSINKMKFTILDGENISYKVLSENSKYISKLDEAVISYFELSDDEGYEIYNKAIEAIPYRFYKEPKENDYYKDDIFMGVIEYNASGAIINSKLSEKISCISMDTINSGEKFKFRPGYTDKVTLAIPSEYKDYFSKSVAPIFATKTIVKYNDTVKVTNTTSKAYKIINNFSNSLRVKRVDASQNIISEEVTKSYYIELKPNETAYISIAEGGFGNINLYIPFEATIGEYSYKIEDINYDNEVDILDLSNLSLNYNKTTNYENRKNDFNKDNFFDIYDLVNLSRKIK